MRHITAGCTTFLLILISMNTGSADIGIIAALNANMEKLKQEFAINETVERAGRKYYSGRMGNMEAVLVRSPMGKVNNAITAQILLSDHPITSVVSIGPAGAVKKELTIGDIVVATEVFQHDFGTIKPYGFIWDSVPDGAGKNEHGYHLADRALGNAALLYGKQKKKRQNRILKGIIVTGDQFISAQSKRQWLFRKFKAAAVDMGAAAIAQVCYANRVPYCILRVITDKPGVGARIDFEKSYQGYRSDIDIPLLLEKGILSHLPDAR